MRMKRQAELASRTSLEAPPPEEELIKVNVIKRDKRTVADLEREIKERKKRRLNTDVEQCFEEENESSGTVGGNGGGVGSDSVGKGVR